MNTQANPPAPAPKSPYEGREAQTWPQLTPAQIARLAAHGRKVALRKGEVLAEPGDRVPMYVVLSGSIEVVQPGLNGEVPVVVRVEIGSVEMRAKEWAALGPGDVISLGRKIGEGVTLRVGGVTIARGELVDVEGEVGVRILGRTEER